MDLKQRKLSKAEWDSMEILVSPDEIEILKLISNGYHDVNIKYNRNLSLFTYLKIEYSEKMEEYLYSKYFSEQINGLIKKYNINYIKINVDTKIVIKKADQIRLSKTDSNIENLQNIFEFVLIKHMEQLFDYKKKNDKKWMYHYFTLHKLIENSISISKINKFIKQIVTQIVNYDKENIDLLHIICNSVEYIEKNTHLLKYNDMMLYDHQKEIFTAVKSPKPKLILYIAPTGTGKTLTPLGLSENHKIIFVCAARHVGLALARAAISINKKIAFAFGCSSAEDIRLHYFAAKEFTVDRRSGGIRKVDNTIGDKVEILICDIKSYIPAMYYMLAFNAAANIITYWDEPTITLDYENHEFHDIIHKNWKENLIPNFVLSSATLPKLHEITNTIHDFQEKFPAANICNIVSHDCRKTIPLINNNGYVVMPHYLTDEYDELIKIIQHCEQNLTLLRYFDLKETSEFIHMCETNQFIRSAAKIGRNFGSIDDIDMKSIKLHYLKVVRNILPEIWDTLNAQVNIMRRKRILANDTIDPRGNKIQKVKSIGPGIGISQSQSTSQLALGLGLGNPLTRQMSEQIPLSQSTPSLQSIVDARQGHSSNVNQNDGMCAIYVTTKDAHTLTDGPTIFLAKDVQKIAKFCIQQANIPAVVMQDIMQKIEFNNDINEKIVLLEQEIETEMEKQSTKGETNSNSGSGSGSKDKKGKTKAMDEKVGKTKDKRVIQLQEQIEMCRGLVKHAALNDIFVPNKLVHLNKWAETLKPVNPFTSDIDEETIISIMLLKDVEDSWKILLLLGIGVFTTHESIEYTEIMKKMADQQKLYMIIADTDYIYGTNYQFCHGYLSKDLELTQEKIIQAMGRIGRNNIQQEYSVRFRDDEQIKLLFRTFLPEEKPEVVNMNLLFHSK
jgi:hypothetical protein